MQMQIKQHRAHRQPRRDHDLILIIGDGYTMRDDLDEFISWGIAHDAGALGRAVREYPSVANGIVKHWFNADGELSIAWAKTLPALTVKHTFGDVDGFDVDWELEQPDYNHGTITGEEPGSRMHGSSALFATMASIEMGYRKVVLAGCPLDTEGHYYFPQNKETLGPIWLGYDFMAWMDFSDMMDSVQVRSMSGYTAKIIGKATKGWSSE